MDSLSTEVAFRPLVGEAKLVWEGRIPACPSNSPTYGVSNSIIEEESFRLAWRAFGETVGNSSPQLKGWSCPRLLARWCTPNNGVMVKGMRGPGDGIALGKLSLPFQLICNTHASEAIEARKNCNDILHIPLNTHWILECKCG